MKTLNDLLKESSGKKLINSYIALNNGSLKYNDKLVKKLSGLWLDRIWAERGDMGITEYLKSPKIYRYLYNI